MAALADVHGNATALEAVLTELEREPPDLIVSCGDLTWGALPHETVALLEPWRERALFVRGNSERELLERKLTDSEVAHWEWERHDGSELRDYLTRTQTQVTVDIDGLGPTLFCHGSPRSDEECVTVATPDERVGEFTAGVQEACIIVTAHTHMQYDRRVGRTRLLNPGSVGLPYEPDPGHAYWALLGPEIELRRTAYDLEAALQRMRAAGMPAFDRIEELMRTPPPHAEVIEHAERVVFSG